MRELGPYQPRSVDALFRGNLISGLVPALGNGAGGGDQSHDITLSAGAVRQESGTENYGLTSALTKQIDASWAVGTDQGGLDGTESVAGTPDASTWYHLWLIHNTAQNLNDMLFSESASAPTLPSGWTWERRLGAVLTDGSANIIAFHAYETTGGGVEFVWDVIVLDVNTTNPGVSAVSSVLSCPTGVQVLARVIATLTVTTVTSDCLVTEIAQTDTLPTSNLRHLRSTTDARVIGLEMTRQVDTSAQVRYRLSVSNANTNMQIRTIGWLDPRLV